MHSDAEAHLLFFDERLLHCDRTLDGIDGTDEIGDDTVAGAAEDAPAISGDALVEDSTAGGQPAQGTDLVLSHQPAVACDIGGEDRRELADRFLLLSHRTDKADPFAVRRTYEALFLPTVADCHAR